MSQRHAEEAEAREKEIEDDLRRLANIEAWLLLPDLGLNFEREDDPAFYDARTAYNNARRQARRILGLES